MIAGTLSRYIGLRFLSAVTAVFAGLLVLVALIDFIEMLRRTGDLGDVSALFVAKISLYRVPFLTERIMPFAVLVAAMFSYLNLSRRLGRQVITDGTPRMPGFKSQFRPQQIAAIVEYLKTVPPASSRPAGSSKGDID